MDISNLDALIKEYIWLGYVSYYDLNANKRNQLLAAYMDYLGEDSFNEIDFNAVFTHHTKRYLKTGVSDYAVDLAETIKKQLENSFKSFLIERFDEKFCEQKVDVMMDQGFRIVKDNVTGETIYIKG